MTLSVVTGGTGFVGRRLVQSLVARGDKVRVLDITVPQPDDDLHGKVEFLKTDITNHEAVKKGVTGATTVFHVASVVHTKQNQQDFVFKVNLGGTQNLIQACQEDKDVKKLVYVSSGGVVYQGKDIENGDESLPYATTSRAPYVLSKIEAEKEVLAAASSEPGGLATISLRPHVIFGPGDVRFIPAVIKNAKEGKLKFQIGRGDWMSDYTYVQNLVDACLLADEKLKNTSPISGQAYFITNGEPMPFWDFVRSALKRLDLPPMSDTPLPHQPVLALAYAREWFDTYVRGGTINDEDGFTPFAIKYMCTHHYFSIDRARKDLGYEPKVSVAEGLELTCRDLEEHGAI
ncbi:Short-chain dehydrogenase/reductase family 42E member 1 [Seminavis robusta]|uniref:Short-chain dehydrogenase/reductase family 42E member 1 n=1 Tax=Seminavis robusta TaxID=568900 RepID=A0A9N8H3W0_9STRA|nr:Short-chain dehydrogenase/reductase family 42E member 1 [Seminavis robusta]|eukprot:Sro98_g050320.1 Short-chain dehydrogenase/reductase family 42E member 1 (346) ;mRNA; r:20866-21903